MSLNTRIHLVKSRIKPKEEPIKTLYTIADKKWPYSSWAEAVDAFSNVKNASEFRFPIVIDGTDGILHSVEMLQKLANLPNVPPMETTSIAQRNGDDAGLSIQIAIVGWEDVKLLMARTCCEEIFVDFSPSEQQPSPAPAVLVTSVDNKWAQRPWVPWAPASWGVVMDAHSRSGHAALPKHPIIINGLAQESPIQSPEALQKLLGLNHPPLLTTTRLTRRAGDWSGEAVQVAAISLSGLDLLSRLAITEERRVWFPDTSLRMVLPRFAYVIESIRDTPIEEKPDKWKYWNEAVAAYGRGELMPEARTPVITTKPGEDNPLTAKRIQRLAELSHLPKIWKTTITESADGLDDTEVEIIDLNSQQVTLLEERAECDSREYVWFPDRQTGKPKVRTVVIVKKIKDKWLESLEWEERLELGEEEGRNDVDLE